MTIAFESTFAAARERNIGIEEFPKLVCASLDQAISCRFLEQLKILNYDSKILSPTSNQDSQMQSHEVCIKVFESLTQRWFNTMMCAYEETLKQAAKVQNKKKVGAISALRSNLKTHQQSTL